MTSGRPVVISGRLGVPFWFCRKKSTPRRPEMTAGRPDMTAGRPQRVSGHRPGGGTPDRMKVPPLGNYNSIKLSAAVPTNHLQLFLTSTYWFVLPDVDVPVFSDVDVPGN
jgi:hypothetical protein